MLLRCWPASPFFGALWPPPPIPPSHKTPSSPIRAKQLPPTSYAIPLAPRPPLPPRNSGVVVKAKNAPQGEIYAKWKRASNRQVGQEGDEEEARGGNAGASTGGGGGWGSGGGRGRRGGWGDTDGGAWGEGEEGGGVKAGKDRGGRVVRDELKTKGQIRKNKQKVCSLFVVVVVFCRRRRRCCGCCGC